MSTDERSSYCVNFRRGPSPYPAEMMEESYVSTLAETNGTLSENYEYLGWFGSRGHIIAEYLNTENMNQPEGLPR